MGSDSYTDVPRAFALTVAHISWPLANSQGPPLLILAIVQGLPSMMKSRPEAIFVGGMATFLDGVGKDLPPGQKLVLCFRPFLEHLVLSDSAPKPFRNSWTTCGCWAARSSAISHAIASLTPPEPTDSADEAAY